MASIIQFKPKQAKSNETTKQPVVMKEAEAVAAIAVVSALKFYAGQGYDGGKKAAHALSAMQAEIDSQAPIQA